ncbi:DUF4192 family protein [Arthrobacter sp. NA-172]|uniref:DUF4192 family protein n=1 Tax=Arthrobacter sp. NA-172 TaxID=3367524 RepID=UPI003754511E
MNTWNADDGADGVLLALFSDDGWEDGGVVRNNLPLLTDLELVLARRGLTLRDAWFIGSDYWRSAFCTDVDCCPIPGRPVHQILDSRLNAEMVFRGSSVRESQTVPAPGQPVVDPDPEFTGAEDAALEGILRCWRSKKAFEEMLDVWIRVLDSDLPKEFDAEAAAFLRAALRVPAWRDAVVVLAAAGRDVARGGAQAFGFFCLEGDEEEVLVIPPGLRSSSPATAKPATVKPATVKPATAKRAAGESHAPSGTRESPPTAATDSNALRYGDVLLGLYPENPDWARLATLDQVLALLAGQGGAEARAAALTILGWIRWCQGSGSFADELLSQADAELPGYRLAELLTELVRRGTVCGWAKSRSSAWRKFGGAAA